MACAFGVHKIWAILRVTKIYCYNIFDRTKEKKQHRTYIPTVHLRMMKIHGPAKQAYNTGFCNVLY